MTASAENKCSHLYVKSIYGTSVTFVKILENLVRFASHNIPLTPFKGGTYNIPLTPFIGGTYNIPLTPLKGGTYSIPLVRFIRGEPEYHHTLPLALKYFC